jgi:hypothetical protein
LLAILCYKLWASKLSFYGLPTKISMCSTQRFLCSPQNFGFLFTVDVQFRVRRTICTPEALEPEVLRDVARILKCGWQSGKRFSTPIQGWHILLGTIYQNGVNYTKFPWNIPNCRNCTKLS